MKQNRDYTKALVWWGITLFTIGFWWTVIKWII